MDFTGSFTLPESPYSFAAHIAVVEVNRETGHVEILKYWGVHDSGRIINPLLVEGQIHGGIAQGVGQALTEGIVYSPDGQPLTASFMDYAVPRATTLPDLVMENIDTRIAHQSPWRQWGWFSVHGALAGGHNQRGVGRSLGPGDTPYRHPIDPREGMAGPSGRRKGWPFKRSGSGDDDKQKGLPLL